MYFSFAIHYENKLSQTWRELCFENYTGVVMKTICTFLGLILLISCGKDDAGAENPVSGGTGALDSVTPEEISLTASRRYAPSEFNSHETVIEVDANFTVPTTIDVLEGNSGTGWLQLRVGSRKFCYQGNASNNQTLNGTHFIAKWEKSVLTEPCHSGGAKIPFVPTVSALIGDIVKLTVDGGGCSKGHGACLFTEVDLILVPAI
jgi:hypothetical protein